MSEFNLSHAVSTLSGYVAAANTLWGLFVVATFAAAGFGASMKDDFGVPTAAMLTIAYLAFAAAHLNALLLNLRVQRVIADEIRASLARAPAGLTEYPLSVRAVVAASYRPAAAVAIHLVIDACVIGVAWSSIA